VVGCRRCARLKVSAIRGIGQAVLRRRKMPKPMPPRTRSDSVLGSGTPAGPLSTIDTLSRPLALSLAGSPLRKVSVVEALVAVKVSENCCHTQVVVQVVVQLFVDAPRDVPLAETFTVLVTPKPVAGLSTFATQNEERSLWELGDMSPALGCSVGMGLMLHPKASASTKAAATALLQALFEAGLIPSPKPQWLTSEERLLKPGETLLQPSSVETILIEVDSHP
jgi:hypothetical protein